MKKKPNKSATLQINKQDKNLDLYLTERKKGFANKQMTLSSKDTNQSVSDKFINQNEYITTAIKSDLHVNCSKMSISENDTNIPFNLFTKFNSGIDSYKVDKNYS